MPRLTRQTLLKRIAAASLSLGAGAAAAVQNLEDVPVDLLGELVDDAGTEALEVNDRVLMLRLLARDSRPAVRATVAGALPPLYRCAPDESVGLLRLLASDGSADVREAVTAALSEVVKRAAPVDRVEIVCSWALSEDARARAAIARVLTARIPVLVTDLAIEQLVHDRDPEVRRFAALAARAHEDEDRARYGALLARLETDEQAGVRDAARSSRA
jgi:hypothetical protein